MPSSHTAIRIGSLHLNRAEWEDDSLEWLLGGAYGELTEKVSELEQIPSLTLWGRQDKVIPPTGFGSWPAAKLVNALPKGTFRWVDASGHTPHLEQPAFVASAIGAFVRGEDVPGNADVKDVLVSAERWERATEAANGVLSNAKEKAVELGGAAVERVKRALDN